jgi:hypothetical protein
MRYRGGGVGHKSTRAATNIFKTDRDCLDLKRQANDTGNNEVEPDEPTCTVEQAHVDEDFENADEIEDFGYREPDSEIVSTSESDEEDKGEDEEEESESENEVNELGYADL